MDTTVRLQLNHLDANEVAVVTPKSVLDLLILDDSIRREITFDRNPDWVDRYERLAGSYMLAWASDLIDRAPIKAGEKVADLACGTGFVARQLRERFGNGVDILGIDPDPAMAFEASRQVDDMDFHRRAAEDTGLPSSSLDHILCQQGLQYFADPQAALDEAFRVLRSGGRLLLSISADSQRNPFLMAQLSCIQRYLKSGTVDDIMSRTVTGLGGPPEVEALLTRSGFAEVDLEWREIRLEIPSFEGYVSRLVANSAWGSFFHGQLSDVRKQEVIEGISSGFEWNGDTPIAVMNSLYVTGSKA